ncbi:MAG TPA: sigma-70 family RNA polymerase sigma factor [Phycisphaerae bacterium]|nr:sigma-70 family RNA polymerase sigma factor [Phycisphaerae bacterium]
MPDGQGPASQAAGPKATISFEDAALVDQCRKGDMQAFGSLVAKYQDRIFNMVYRMCGRRADAEELTQEAFLKALERIAQFRGHSQFYTWLFRIAANLTISHRRRGGRVRFHSLGGPEEFEQGQADALTAAMARRRDPGPEAAAMAAETNQRVMQALEELDDEFRLVVVLCDMEDMDYAQIADVLAVPVGTVKSRLHRARCMLKEKLADLVRA